MCAWKFALGTYIYIYNAELYNNNNYQYTYSSSMFAQFFEGMIL